MSFRLCIACGRGAEDHAALCPDHGEPEPLFVVTIPGDAPLTPARPDCGRVNTADRLRITGTAAIRADRNGYYACRPVR